MKKKPKRLELTARELDGLLERLRRRLDPKDYEIVKAMAETIAYLSRAVDQKGVSVKRLLRMIFGCSTEKTRKVLKGALREGLEGQEEREAGEETTTEKAEESQSKRPGHGRNAASEYTGAERIEVPHESLKAGDDCPECKKGKVYEQSAPATLVRVRGQAPLGATVYELERLRCNLCGEVFTAGAPEGVGSEKYDAGSVSLIALLKYGSGLPFNRLEGLQRNLGIPLPASTQWDVIHQPGKEMYPAYEELIRQAAQGEVIHNDDTPVKILELMKENEQRRAISEKSPERTGMQTTGIIAKVGERKIAVFLSGRRHAGENLDHVLGRRNADLGKPIQMCDGLSRNLPSEFKTLLGNCVVHSRRKYVEVAENFPSECKYVLETLKAVYKNDALAKEENMSGEERLKFHQEKSAPLMDKLEIWLEEQFAEKKVEPNSGLGEAISYMQNHWEPLTLFLREAGAPLDNSVCERALKKAILNRKNSYFFKTQHGAEIADVYMSLIYSSELSGANAFEYLTELQKHTAELSENPAAWMPWNYKEALGRPTES